MTIDEIKEEFRKYRVTLCYTDKETGNRTYHVEDLATFMITETRAGYNIGRDTEYRLIGVFNDQSMDELKCHLPNDIQGKKEGGFFYEHNGERKDL